MVRFLKTLSLALVVVVGAWLLLNKDQIEQPQDVLRLAREKLASFEIPDNVGDWPATPAVTPSNVAPRPSFDRLVPMVASGDRRVRTSIRIASMMIDGAGVGALEQTNLVLADVCRRYDVIALQGIKTTPENSAVSLLRRMNEAERGVANGPRPSYRLLLDQQQGGASATQLAIIYDEAAVELDDNHWYVVRDPDGILTHKPMVAWFRARGVSSEQAFTFSLANLRLDSQRPDRELVYLSELFRAIRDDGRGEDDVIIAGNFNSGDRGLAPIQQKSGLTWVISGIPTNTNRTAQFDNIVFNPAATVEFTQQGGVFDFMKHYNLRLADAQQISTHLPVWAEFSLREGDASNLGRTARK